MCGVDHLHAGVSVVPAAEGAPAFGVGVEPVGPLSAALRRQQRGSAGEQARAFLPPRVTFTSAAVPRPESVLPVMPVTNRPAVV